MRNGAQMALTCGVLLAAPLQGATAQDRPPPGSVIGARPAWRYDPAQRCPGLEVSPKGYGAVVDFFVNAAGAPSKAFISTSSKSDTLDAAALACVGKLKFQPAAHLGDGVPMESWQRLALKAEDPPPQPPAAATSGAPAAGAAAAAAPVAAAAPSAAAAKPAASAAAPASLSAPVAAAAPTAAAVGAAAAGSAAGAAQPGARPVEVRACSDASGRAQEPTLVQSSGNPQLDQAALTIARSGSAYLRQAAESGGKAGCVQIAVKLEAP